MVRGGAAGGEADGIVQQRNFAALSVGSNR